jgi:hypothetical protein
MDYKLYTLVDITHTKQTRFEPKNELLWYKEQNFNTLLQTLGLRSNIHYVNSPQVVEVQGNLIGFDTTAIIRVWRFDWSTERDNMYLEGLDPVGLLKQDFHLVPYIKGLDELMEQQYAVFSTVDPGANIVFHFKQ